ncbi:MAG: 3-dehydroquinate synthase family protein [Phycisphaerales bacterium]
MTPAPQPTPQAHTIRVAAASRTYDVLVAPKVLHSLGEHLRRVTPAKRAHLITDAVIPNALLATARASLEFAGYAVTISTTPAEERHKSLDAAQRLLSELLAAGHERTDPVVTLGGGIVTDLAGFVAATYRRGVPVVHCPTTLLAMVDAAVGGKSGVNLPLSRATTTGGTSPSSESCPLSLMKNMVGAFWQPHLVLCDADALASLPARHLRAGMAECLKHALLAAGLPAGAGQDAALWRWTLDHLDAALALDHAAMSELIARNIAVKAAVVASDEREEAPSAAGGRALLNLGHTYAHAIETLEGLTPLGQASSPPSTRHALPPDSPPAAPFTLHHGEAVALGLIAAAFASAQLGWLSAADAQLVRDAVARAGLPIALRGLPTNELLRQRMMHDKKTAGGALRVILLKRLGEASVVERPDAGVVDAGWDAIRQ